MRSFPGLFSAGGSEILALFSESQKLEKYWVLEIPKGNAHSLTMDFVQPGVFSIANDFRNYQ
jgi:hypothetical protein